MYAGRKFLTENNRVFNAQIFYDGILSTPVEITAESRRSVGVNFIGIKFYTRSI